MVKKNIQPVSDPVLRKESLKIFINQIVKEDIRRLSQGQYSQSSELAMTSDWNRFVLFCQSKHVNPLPASVTAVRLFLESEARERKYASIRRYSITIATIHFLHACPDPTANQQIRFTLSQLKLLKSGDARQATALTYHHLTALQTALLKEGSIRSQRDLAIYFVMFECALKRSELKTLTLEDVEFRAEHTVITIQHTHYQLSDAAGQSLARWIRYLSGSQGYLFRRIDKHGNIGMHQLDDSSIYRILRRAGDLLGLDHQHRFTGQSARVGAAKELESQGYHLKDIQDFGRWLSPAMPAQYIRQPTIAEEEMARFKITKP